MTYVLVISRYLNIYYMHLFPSLSIVGVVFIHKIVSIQQCTISYTISVWKAFKGTPSKDERLELNLPVEDGCPFPELDSKHLYLVAGKLNNGNVVANPRGGIWDLADRIEEKVAIECDRQQ